MEEKIFGILASGRKWVVMESRKKCVGPPDGNHYILVVEDAEADETPAEKAELWSLALDIAPALAPNGRWRIGLNGPNLAVRPTFHIHVICAANDIKVMRLTDPIVVTE